MVEFRNRFSWSFTRHKMFHECRRLYYLNYYGYWDGWSDDAGDDVRLTYRLKKMQSLPMWLGSIVHEMIERILGDARNQELNSLDRYQQQARDKMNRGWVQSTEKKWMWKPKWNLNLFEHYYDVEITKEQRLAMREKVFRCLENFMESDLFDGLERLRPTEWKSVEKLDQFVVGEEPVYVKIDCATMCDEVMTIYDWKTGKLTDDTAVQLGCYALYVHHVWHTPVEKQDLVSYYLDANKIVKHSPTVEELIETKDFILRSMEEMIEALDSTADENTATAENFPMTENRGKCRRCFFRERCYGTREWE